MGALPIGAWMAAALLLAAPGGAQNYEVLYSFGGGADGSIPLASLIRDVAGNLYSTTLRGGASDAGTVFKLDPAGHETVLFSFSGGYDGNDPVAPVTFGPGGKLYGTTSYGGARRLGVLFKLNPGGKETVVHSFAGAQGGGAPWAGLLQDVDGSFYGTTRYGGPFGYGVVFKFDSRGRETVLHSFSGGEDGSYPEAPVIRDAAGNTYGTAEYGGAYGFGVVFKIEPSGKEVTLCNFGAGADGAFPTTGLAQDAAGNLYGTTESGGIYNAGTVFKLDRSGHETVLYTFQGRADGGDPRAGVVPDGKGNLYGTTFVGGSQAWGTIFKLDAGGRLTTLHAFTGGTDGSSPSAGLMLGEDGALYGTADGGGSSGNGVVFKLKP